MFLHKDYIFPDINPLKVHRVKLYTRMTSVHAKKKIALSFRKGRNDDSGQISVIPPLLRREIVLMAPEKGDYVNALLLDKGLMKNIDKCHKSFPNIPLRFFWNNLDAESDTKIDDTLSYHLIDDAKFLDHIEKCKIFANNGCFESICEAM